MAASPIKFGTDGWRALIADAYTYDNLSRVAQATAAWARQRWADTTPQIMVGYDTRFNGAGFARLVANELAEAGCQVFLSPGFVSTPMVSLATAQRQAHLGVVITASHNPPGYNGFKIKGWYGGPAFPSIVAEVEALVPEDAQRAPDRFEEHLQAGRIQHYDMEALYLNHVKSSFDLDAIRQSPFRVGYDAMYGAGQRVMPRLFPKGVMLHCDENPGFRGQAPEPIERNLAEFQAAIRQQGLHFGLATDGDADRIGLFDETGTFVDSHHILLLLIYYLVEYKKLTGKVVYTFSCTSKVQALCDHYGLTTEVTKIGFKYIGEIMEREEVLVGGEESGGIAVAGHVPERDGIFIGLTLLEFMAKSGQTLTQLVQAVYDRVGSFAVRRNDLHLQEAQKHAIMARCKAGQVTQLGPYTVNRTEDLDGYKFHLGQDQWVMVRPSGTEPVLRVYAEAATAQAADAILAATEQELLSAVQAN